MNVELYFDRISYQNINSMSGEGKILTEGFWHSVEAESEEHRLV